ncbi:hypothetical protein IKF63_01690 [Candidatus Saccharibacteria bacterium]|nr:hypothetical protein [Candidatus Saccharibacteria bacterium]
MENTKNLPKSKSNTKPKISFKAKTQRARAKLLSSYYGNPIRDMKLICVTGTSGKATVAHFVHEILRSAGQHVAVLASDGSIKTSVLHKFFSEAWKAGSNYCVVTAPADALKNNVFYGLPIHVAALTDFLSPSLTTPTPESFLESESTLFQMNPEIVVLNEDDANYPDFSKFVGTEQTLTYGTARSSTIRIDSAKLYKKGTEANFSLGSNHFTCASFLTGETVVSYMACAAAIATSLHISTDTISEGIANYNPDNVTAA